jgi:4-carboxymuconolactone decarboxylase
MAQDKQPSGAQKAFGDFAPALVGYTDDVLFGQVWQRAELSPRDRSLITVASLLTSGSTEQLIAALDIELTEDEIRHLEEPYTTQPAYWW